MNIYSKQSSWYNFSRNVLLCVDFKEWFAYVKYEKKINVPTVAEIVADAAMVNGLSVLSTTEAIWNIDNSPGRPKRSTKLAKLHSRDAIVAAKNEITGIYKRETNGRT